MTRQAKMGLGALAGWASAPALALAWSLLFPGAAVYAHVGDGRTGVFPGHRVWPTEQAVIALSALLGLAGAGAVGFAARDDEGGGS